MRKSKHEAAETRKRIVTAAANEFCGKGIVATGLCELMSAAGLTHGGFYKHFESKDQLVAEACAGALASSIEMCNAAECNRPPSQNLAAAVAEYLSSEHRDDPSGGCPLAALGSEIARCDQKTRATATEGFLKIVDILAGHFADEPPDVARARALVAVSTMVGALTLSRIVTDAQLSDEILRQAEKHLIQS
jgi:TetR/AcrR family transcriptional repressor of nem operon